jgi:hypothetical protein
MSDGSGEKWRPVEKGIEATSAGKHGFLQSKNRGVLKSFPYNYQALATCQISPTFHTAGVSIVHDGRIPGHGELYVNICQYHSLSPSDAKQKCKPPADFHQLQGHFSPVDTARPWCPSLNMPIRTAAVDMFQHHCATLYQTSV